MSSKKTDETSLWMPSIMTRLTRMDDLAGVTEKTYCFETYVAEIQQDLTQLLNTKQVGWDLPDTLQDQPSILTYGLPDLTLFNPDSPEDTETVRKLLEKTIEQFEPRLTHVAVLSQKQPAKVVSTVMSFCIHAHLKVNPQPMPIRFDSVIEPANDWVQISSPMEK